MCSHEQEPNNQIFSSTNGASEGTHVVPSCPVCCCEILAEDESVACPDCATMYHKDCWEENKGCAIYGCQSAHCLDVHAQQQEQESGQNEISCPWCYTLVSPKTVICPSCGNRIDQTMAQPPVFNYQNQASHFFANAIEKISKNVLIPLWNCHVLLWKDCLNIWKKIAPHLLVVLKTYGKTLSRYKEFSGTSNRLDYFCFSLISVIVYFLLLMLSGNYTLVIIYLLATACPTVAIMTRRLRDIGLSAWFLFAVPFLPFLLFCPSKPSNINNNQNDKESNN